MTDEATAEEPVAAADLEAVHRQLGRPPRGVVGVAHRCPCGQPDVVETAPVLDDGTPFPTTYYLTCPRATGAVSTLESQGLMRDMTARLGSDPQLAAAYRSAHEDYLRRRDRLGHVPQIAGISAGGMPDRVKCLHVLAGHALAAGPGVNPLGDETLAALPAWWAAGPCASADASDGEAAGAGRGGASVDESTGPVAAAGAEVGVEMGAEAAAEAGAEATAETGAGTRTETEPGR